ncbi:MAG TPA: long-chain fatty acid--CoA ligase [Candidatus Dormibacteraeota bacterium]|nr:long-chain fatty acid--CoA ligase [Candidatus Dormibacteraeota bacterium]
MMDVELNSWLMFEHAPKYAPDAEVVSRLPSGELHRYTYGDFAGRAQQLMHALDGLGVQRGERVATLAWNSYRHLESYFAIPCTGRVLHTLNARLSPEDLAYIIGHADDRAVLVDPDFLPLIEEIRGRVPGLRHVIVLDDRVPDTSLDGVIAYEDLIADRASSYSPIDIPERTPLGLCYTSGTTGRPKGAQYTHRSTFLHAFAVTSATAMAIGPGDSVLSQVPMFHANAWGMPYGSTLAGAKQVYFAGPLLAGPFVDLLVTERVTVSAGVPTIWLTVADEVGARGGLPDMRHIIVGGSQPPRALITRYWEDFGLRIVQAWGMTETSPLASVAWPQERMRGWDEERVTDAARIQAGIPLPGVDVSIRDEEGRALPFDGETMGNLYVRGPWVIDGYLKDEGDENFATDGWFRTGDVAIGSPGGYFVIADRTKDLIKSGGEWISSVEMESAIMAMPAVLEAAVVAVPDPKWQERPLACVVLRGGGEVTLQEVHTHLTASGFAHWQLPTRLEIIDAVPKTSVGKFDKKVLRANFGA